MKKKAKIILIAMSIITMFAVITAFKLARFTGLFAWKPTVGTITFTTALGGPVYTAAGTSYCITFANVTFDEQPGQPIFNYRIVPVAGIITGTAPSGLTTTTQIYYKSCNGFVDVYTTMAF